jgi:DNA-binding MarR family transcriptional regulator
VYWTDTADGHHCTRHNYTFKRGEVCHECVTDPGDELGHVVESTEYQRQLRARVSEYQSRARTCWRKVMELDEDGTAREENVAVKWSAEAVKWSRLAEEMQKQLDDREHELTLLRHEREMSGRRRGN